MQKRWWWFFDVNALKPPIIPYCSNRGFLLLRLKWVQWPIEVLSVTCLGVWVGMEDWVMTIDCKMVMTCSVGIFLNQAFPKLPKQGPLTSQRSACLTGLLATLSLWLSPLDLPGTLSTPGHTQQPGSMFFHVLYWTQTQAILKGDILQRKINFRLTLLIPPPAPMLITRKSIQERCMEAMSS